MSSTFYQSDFNQRASIHAPGSGSGADIRHIDLISKSNSSVSSSADADSNTGATSGTANITSSSSNEADGDNSHHKLFSCDMCDKVFTRKHNLETHKLVHSQNKPYTCTICKSGFKRSHDLKRHQRMHTGEKPHMCNKCDRSFARADALLRHVKNGCNSTFVTKIFQTSDHVQKSSPYDQPSQKQVEHEERANSNGSSGSPAQSSTTLANPDKRSYETVHWKATITNPIDQTQLKEHFNRASNSIVESSTHFNASPFQNPQAPVFDISNNPSNTRNTSMSDPVSSQARAAALFGKDASAASKISYLEHKVAQLEKHIDGDEAKIRELENRLVRLESAAAFAKELR